MSDASFAYLFSVVGNKIFFLNDKMIFDQWQNLFVTYYIYLLL